MFFETQASWLYLIAPSAVLIAGLIDDLRSKKIHNKLVILLLALAAIYQFVVFGQPGLVNGLMASGFALLIFLPMVLSRMLGAGDMKLMLAFGMSTLWINVLWTSVYAIIWGAVFGILHALLQKKFKHLFFNTINLVASKGKVSSETQKIPFTVPLLLGWIHQIIASSTNGGLW